MFFFFSLTLNTEHALKLSSAALEVWTLLERKREKGEKTKKGKEKGRIEKKKKLKFPNNLLVLGIKAIKTN